MYFPLLMSVSIRIGIGDKPGWRVAALDVAVAGTSFKDTAVAPTKVGGVGEAGRDTDGTCVDSLLGTDATPLVRPPAAIVVSGLDRVPTTTKDK